MDGDIKVVFAPLTRHEVIIKWAPRIKLLHSESCFNTLCAIVAPGESTRMLFGRMDQENIFRECAEKNLSEMISSLGDDESLYAVEVPMKESPLHLDILVHVGIPPVRQPATWQQETIRPPIVLRLLRVSNYDSLYESVRLALADECPYLPDYDKTEPEGLPWWVWTDEQDKQEQDARATWAALRRRYPEVKKGTNPNCCWVRGSKHYFFRLYKMGHPDQHLVNDGLPFLAWGPGLHRLCLEYHPLYARKVFKDYN